MEARTEVSAAKWQRPTQGSDGVRLRSLPMAAAMSSADSATTREGGDSRV